jgi:hypothetical protein
MSWVHTSEDPIPLRPVATAIGTSFDASPAYFSCNDFNQLILECDLSLATATDVRIVVEAANPSRGPVGATIDPVTADWFPISAADGSTASGSGATLALTYRNLEIVLPATGRYSIALPLCYKFVRVKAKTTGGPGATTLKINGTFGKV